VAVAAAAGGATSGVFSGFLHWSRPAFIGAWLGVAGVVLAAYVLTTGLDPSVQFRRRRSAGLVVGVIAGGALAYGVLRQPASPAPTGASLLVALAWPGLVYGVVDALMLTVLPVLALYGSRPAAELARPGGRLRAAGAALLGSLLVTAAYHLGFAEFRGVALVGPLVGNVVVTISYLLAGNPLAPILSHTAMHVAAVLHGAATTAQLPPHY
jgi:hypothetical protein